MLKNTKGFSNNKLKVPMRKFCVELKHRPLGDDGSNEILIDTITLEVPKLRDGVLENQWAFTKLWCLLEDDAFRSKGINQVFIFAADFQYLIARIELNKFDDEASHKLAAPSDKSYDKWVQKISKRFKQIYNFPIENLA